MFYHSLAAWLRTQGFEDVARVISAKVEERNDGYCPTCSYEYTVLVVEYVDAFGDEHKQTVSANFADLIKELSEL